MLMALACCHILPETVSSYDIAKAKNDAEHGHSHRLLAGDHNHGSDDDDVHGGEVPVPYLLFLAGFWGMQLLDQVVFKKID